MKHQDRIAALASGLESAMLVTRLPNLRYLTGFTGSNGFLLAKPSGSAVFVTDGRYGEIAEGLLADLPDVDLVVYTGDMWETLKGVMEGHDRISLEAHGVTWEFVKSMAEKTGIEPIAGPTAVEALRRTKDASEVVTLKAAADAGDAAFAALSTLVESVVTEAELGWALIDAMRRRGGDAADWEPIVAAGPGASVPHYRSGDEPIGSGLLLLDYGCVMDGYHSDMTRTVWLEGAPDERMAGIYAAVVEAEQAGIDAVAPGVPCDAVDEAVRVVLREHGYEEQFLHSTGHGVGLEIHEQPWLRRGNQDPLQAGDAITIEPGVYLAGVGGVRIEDMVIVTEGGPVVLTESPKEFAT